MNVKLLYRAPGASPTLNLRKPFKQFRPRAITARRKRKKGKRGKGKGKKGKRGKGRRRKRRQFPMRSCGAWFWLMLRSAPQAAHRRWRAAGGSLQV